MRRERKTKIRKRKGIEVNRKVNKKKIRGEDEQIMKEMKKRRKTKGRT
jgi:hypothetical protein